MYHCAVHKLAQSVLAYTRKHDLLRPGDRVGVAVSGGADSVGLLRILLELRAELRIILSVVHFNHKLRDAESDADETFVRDLALHHGLEFLHDTAGVKAYAAEKKLSLEAAARELRYGFFERLLQNEELDNIATAHTLDDQAETVLLKLARGAGTRGLAGIYPKVSLRHSMDGARHSAFSRQPQIVRPLLAVRRVELEAYLSATKQSWREDSSNRDLRHTRNRIRHEILPRLEEQVNPAMRGTLAEAAELARAEEEFWTAQTGSHLATVWKRQNGGELDEQALRDHGLALQRRLVRAAGESLGLNLEFRHVEEILGLRQEGARAALPDGWSAYWHKRKIRFAQRPEQPTDYCYPLSIPGTVVVPEAGIAIEAASVPLVAAGRLYNREHLLDSACVREGLFVRNWRAGDRFWPAYSKAPKKIKELLQDRHITGNEKKLWPVVASGEEVVWMKGFGARRDLKTKDETGVLIQEISG